MERGDGKGFSSFIEQKYMPRKQVLGFFFMTLKKKNSNGIKNAL